RGEKVVGVALGAALDPLPFVLLPGEDLDLLDARNVVLQDGVEISQFLLGRLESPPGLAAKGKDSDHQEGDRKQRQQGEAGKKVKEDGRNSCDHQRVDDQIGDVVRDQRLDVVSVVDDARHHLPRLLVLVKAEG